MCKEAGFNEASILLEGESLVSNRKLDMKLHNDGFNLVSENYSEDFLLQLVDKLMRNDVKASIVTKVNVQIPESDIKVKEEAQHIAQTIQKASQHVPTASIVKDIPQSLKDRLPTVNTELVHSEPSESTTFGDKFGGIARDLYKTAGVQHKEDETDFLHTGIKFDHLNRPKYRCGYSCPKCGNAGRHYVPLHIKTVSCHQCQEPLLVEPATDNGVCTGEDCRDEHGNFLVARSLNLGASSYGK